MTGRPFEQEDYGAYLDAMLAPVLAVWPETGDALSTAQPIFLGGWATLHVHGEQDGIATYVTSDVVALTHQLPGPDGNFELLMTCNDARFALWALTAVAQLAEKEALGHGSAIGFGTANAPLQGVVLERFATFTFKQTAFAILRCHGCDSAELKLAREEGVDAFIASRKAAGRYPRTEVPT